MLRLFLIVGMGGMLGTMFRFYGNLFLSRYEDGGFPLSTLFVNIIGCFFIGLFYALSERFNWISPDWKLFLTTGFCGGLTTFSAFAYENMILLQQGKFLLFIAYSFVTFMSTILSVVFGIILIRFFFYS